MVNEPLTNDGDRLKTPVRVGWKPRHRFAVVHAPAVFARKVLAQIAPRQSGIWAHVHIAARVGIVVVDAKQERVDGGPGITQGLHVEDDRCWHGGLAKE